MEVFEVFPPAFVAETESRMNLLTAEAGTTRSTESKPLISEQFGVGGATWLAVTEVAHAYQR